MKVPREIEDAFIPMEPDDFIILQSQRKSRDNYWKMLKRAKSDFIELTEQASLEYEIGDDAFYYYLRQNYGLQVELIDNKIAGEYAIVDEKKYLLFLMKFGS